MPDIPLSFYQKPFSFLVSSCRRLFIVPSHLYRDFSSSIFHSRREFMFLPRRDFSGLQLLPSISPVEIPCSLSESNTRILVPSASGNFRYRKASWCPNIVYISHPLRAVSSCPPVRLVGWQTYLYFVASDTKSDPQQRNQFHRINISRSEFLS